MSTGKYQEYAEEALQPFAEKLLGQHYNTIETLCTNAKKQADRVCSLEPDTTAADYAMLCGNIINDIVLHIEARKEQLIPYINQLTERISTNHDCSSCSGNCKVNHNVQVLNLGKSNDAVRKVLNRLQLATLPLYSETMFPDEYRVLRNRMALIEMNMTELFFLENSYLVPKIVEAQKMINAVRN